MNKAFPQSIKTLLWDTNIQRISLDVHKQFIIERVLEFGDIQDMKWLLTKYSEKEVIEVLKKSKRISAKTGNYYSLIFNIDKSEMLCMKKPFTKKQERFS